MLPSTTLALNRLLQQKLNASPHVIVRGDTSFATGDKVMQVRNNYDKAVFNGDIGFVVGATDETRLTVDFGEQTVAYGPADIDELTHAYCISIHKSQGCEFKAAVICLTTLHYIMLQRNLLYTAITRARQICVLVGTRRALSVAVNNDTALQRYSRLSRRISEMPSGESPDGSGHFS